MGQHHRGNARFDHGPEREQLQLPQAGELVRDQRQSVMGVDVGIAMAGEMLCRGDDLLLPIGVYHCPAQAGHLLRIGAERAHPDDRVGRVVVDIDHRGEVKVDPQNAQLARDHGGVQAGQLVAAGGAQGHVAGENRDPFGKTGHGAAFLVHGNKERHQIAVEGALLDLLRQTGHLGGAFDIAGAAEQDHAPQGKLPQLRRRLGSELRPAEVGDDHLAHFLLQ